MSYATRVIPECICKVIAILFRVEFDIMIKLSRIDTRQTRSVPRGATHGDSEFYQAFNAVFIFIGVLPGALAVVDDAREAIALYLFLPSTSIALPTPRNSMSIDQP